MKRVYSAIGLCAALLIFEAWVFLPASQAKTDVVDGLLRVPAPPPPNPLVSRHTGSKRLQDPYNVSNPPDDNAPTDELLEYWSAVQRQRQALGYTPDPSERTLGRLFKEIDKDHSKLLKLLGSFPDGEKTADFVKGIYDQEGTTGVFSKDERKTIKNWLVYHSPYFSNELYQMAEKTGDTDTYVTNQEELLALTRVDFDKARPLIDRLYANGPDKVSRVLARWALYRHALDTDATGDIERYRDELKAVVEDKTLSAPMRDLAMDALVSEKEWSGRDDWYTGLMADETLGDLGTYTGLTTLINVSPPEKYLDKMLELLKSDNKAVRTAAVRNLLLKGNGTKPEVIKAMLPWLEDPNWANDVGGARMGIINALSSIKLPESVPGLIRTLDEKKKQRVTSYAEATNVMVSRATNAANAAANAASYAANLSASTVASSSGRDIEVYAYRSPAVTALGFQADPAAGPALRRVLNEAQGYDRMTIIDALLKCRGFSVPEQVDAFESAVKKQVMAEELARAAANTNAPILDYYGDNSPYGKPGAPTQADIKQMIGQRLLISGEVPDDLVYGVIARIDVLDGREPRVAAAMREVVMRWPNATVNVLFLRDLKADKADVPSVIRLLAMRKLLRAQFSSDVFDSRAVSPTANGIVTCILEDTNDYDAILAADNAEAKTALLACARLIRAPLPVLKVAEYVHSSDQRLAAAAEKYLESEDSPAARAIVLGLHPGEAKILGATDAFYSGTDKESGGMYRQVLFASVDPTDPTAGTVSPGEIYEEDESYPGESEGPYARQEPEPENLENTEKTLQDEVKKDAELLGVYAYARNYVRIYKDRVIFSWDEDSSRYRERPLTTAEFDTLKFYLTDHHVDELVPFLACDTDPCTERELLMLGRNGGRRVYSDGGSYDFFNGLDRYFADLKREPGTLKYSLSREIPGLEILMANDDLEAETVWKSGSDLRVAVTDLPTRRRVEEEIDKAVEKAEDKDNDVEPEAEIAPSEALRIKLTQKRAFDGVSWRQVASGNAAGDAAQPPGFDLVPVRDGTAVPATNEQWKARTPNFEIRLSDDSVFKFAAGRLSPILKGEYSDPVVTPNGKWAIVNRGITGDGEESSLVRINLLTNRAIPVKLEGYRTFEPSAYITSINKVLVVEKQYYYGGETMREIKPQLGEVAMADPEASEMMLLDPDTGVMQPIVGEMGPLTQQTFRPLQKAVKPNEFWAAIPDVEKKTTSVGIYNTNNFGFKPVLQIPKIVFNSMSMWVDEGEGKIYFCYRGHLLSLPLKQQ